MIKKALWCVIILAALMILGGEVTAQEDGVVYAVLFYSPTCTYCPEVIKEDLPAMEAEFGDRLRVLTINVYLEGGAQLFEQSCQAYDESGVWQRACNNCRG